MSDWTLNLLIMVPMLILIGASYIWLYRKRTEGRKFPFADVVHRLPGQTLSDWMYDLAYDVVLYFSGAIGTPILAYAIYLQHLVLYEKQLSPIVAIALLVSASMVSAFCIVKLVRSLDVLHRYRLGYAGEVAVGGALTELLSQGYSVFHDIPGEGPFNIDHILVGPAGVFAVETKTKTKRQGRDNKDAHKVVHDGDALYFSDRPGVAHKKFLEQASMSAKYVSQWLSAATGMKVDAIPVLVMPGWYIALKQPGKVKVLNHKQLGWLTKAPSKLNKQQIEQVVYQIKQKSRADTLKPKLYDK